MNISKEETGALTATVNVQILEEDYTESVKKVLKDYQRKADMPGFRKGKVPFGMIQKMYGKAAIMDEVNKLLSENLQSYLKDNEIEILGDPMPNFEKSSSPDWDNDKEFNFAFDLGLSPKFELELKDSKLPYYSIKVDDDTVDNYLNDIRKRYGVRTSADSVQEEDIVAGEFVELDVDGKDKEGGFVKNSMLQYDSVRDEDVKKELKGKKAGDVIQLNIQKISGGNLAEITSILDVKREEAEKIDSDFRFTITEITRMEPAEINEELFSKVYQSDSIKNEEELRDRIRKDAEESFVAEADKKFLNDSIEKTLENNAFDLPDEFLKNWLVQSSEGKLTEDQVDEEYDRYRDSLRWQLIENKIIKEKELEVTQDDAREYVKKWLGIGMPAGDDDEERAKRMEEMVDMILKNQEEAKKIYERLYDDRLREMFKETYTMNKKEVTFDEFVKLAQEKN